MIKKNLFISQTLSNKIYHFNETRCNWLKNNGYNYQNKSMQIALTLIWQQFKQTILKIRCSHLTKSILLYKETGITQGVNMQQHV